MKNRVTVRLPGVREDTNLIGFGVWWDDPTGIIPIGNVVKYALRQYLAGREWYDVVLEFPDGVLEAWEGRSGVVLWDDYLEEEVTPQDDVFTNAYDPLAALFLLLSRGGYHVVSKEEARYLEWEWAFEE